MNFLRSKEFWDAISIVVMIVVLTFLANIRLINFDFFIGPLSANHWFVLIGSLYIAIIVPIIAILKKRKQQKILTLFRIHVFGNLLAFLLVSIHFVGQISRAASAYPELGTGLALYIIMILLVATGFNHRFKIISQIKSTTRRFVHISLSFSFYILIVIHILHGFGII
jgi:hypothetical protein